MPRPTLYLLQLVLVRTLGGHGSTFAMETMFYRLHDWNALKYLQTLIAPMMNESIQGHGAKHPMLVGAKNRDARGNTTPMAYH